MIKQPKNTMMRVDPRTGGFMYHVVDLVIPGKGFDIRFERWHDSMASFGFQAGWEFEWDERVEFDPDGSFRYWYPNHRMERFEPNGDGSYEPAVPWNYSRVESISDSLVTIRLKNGQLRVFDRSHGRLLRRVDLSGNTQRFTWDPTGLEIWSIEDASGRIVQAQWEVPSEGSYDRIVRFTDWAGRVVTYGFKGGFLTGYIDPEGGTTRYTSNSEDIHFVGIESIDLPSGRWLTNYPKGLSPEATVVARQVFGNGRELLYSYDSVNRRTVMIEPGPTILDPGRTWTWEWDTDGNIIKKTDPLGNAWEYEHNDLNLVTKVIEPNLATVEMTFDDRGNMLTRKNQKGKTWTYEYHEVFNKVTKITGPAPFNYVQEWSYDTATGAMLSYTDARLKTWLYEHYPDGLLKKVTDPNSNTMEYAYNQFGQMVQVTNGLGKIRKFEYDLVGNQVAAVDPLNLRTTRNFDRLNRVVSITSPLGNTTRMGYDAQGNLKVVTDPMNRGTQFEYSSMDDLLRMLDAAGGELKFGYDLRHNLIERVDQNGHAYRFAYDALDRTIRVTDPMGQETDTAWDPFCGNYTVTDAEGHPTTWSRDVTCLLTRRTFRDGSFFELTYDEEGRRTGMTQPHAKKLGQFLYGAEKYGYDPSDDTTFSWDGANHLTEVAYPYGNSIGFTWDDGGRLTRITDIHATFLDYTWDAANRLTQVTRASKDTDYTWDDADRLIQISHPNGVTCDITHDDDSRITRMLWKLGVSVLYDIEYRYDRAGNRVQRKVTKAFTPAVVEDFTYDALNRLTRSTVDGALRNQYLFDPAGNRLQKKSANAENFSAFDASDELVATGEVRFAWDRIGQLVEKADSAQANTTRFGWNYAHRLWKVTLPDGSIAENRFNADELRCYRKEAVGAVTNYFWIPDGVLGLSQVLNEIDVSGATRANYVLGPVGMIAVIDGEGNEHYYITDALASVLALADEAGGVTETYDYDEYGVQLSSNEDGLNLNRYTGQQTDLDANLLYLRNRHYSPEHGRFIRRDPLRESLLRTSSASMFFHDYVYVHNRPTVYTDPTGLKTRAECDSDFSWCLDKALSTSLLCLLVAGLGAKNPWGVAACEANYVKDLSFCNVDYGRCLETCTLEK